MPQVTRARWLMLAAAVLTAGGATATGHWKAAIGLMAGLLAMIGALELARMRASGLTGAHRPASVRLVHGLLQIGKYIVGFGLFWIVLNTVKAPLWSVCAGVTIGVICLMVGFAIRSAQEMANDQK